MNVASGLALAWLLTGCAIGEVAYDPDWMSEAPFTDGKADDAFGPFHELALGGEASSSIDPPGSVTYRLRLERGDEVTLSVDGWRGLDPFLAVYDAHRNYVYHREFRRDNRTAIAGQITVIKRYHIELSGDYFVVVRAHRDLSRGDYVLRAICEGGTCSGEPPPPLPLNGSNDVAACLLRSANCALAAVRHFDEQAGTTDALFRECLGSSEAPSGALCQPVCEYNAEAAIACESVRSTLPFFSDQPLSCIDIFDACIAECGGDPTTAFEVAGCWDGCDAYARRINLCGGPLAEDSYGACAARCEAVSNGDCACDCRAPISDAERACGAYSDETASCVEEALIDTGAAACVRELPTLCGELGCLRVVAANLSSGRYQNYDAGHGLRILQGIRGDVILLQEFSYFRSDAADLASFARQACGEECTAVRGTGYIPNGIVSRFPIIEWGQWEDTSTDTREHLWARIDIPGDTDLWVVSVHWLTSGDTARAIEAAEIVTATSVVPRGDLLVVGGDFNTGANGMGSLSEIVNVSARPTDQTGNPLTNGPRSRALDGVFVSDNLHRLEVPVRIGAQRHEGGLVVDTRVYTPIEDLAPAMRDDSSAFQMQHMAVVRDFRLN